MAIHTQAPIMVDIHLPAHRSLRVALVTETYLPEVNGVAATVARLVEGLRGRGHTLQLVRPRQDAADTANEQNGFAEVLMRGLPIPRYPQLKMGLPSKRALLQLWATRQPDVVHIATEGPLGWSALQAAVQLRLPVVSDFRTNFHAYTQHYGLAWLRSPVMAYLRKFHNRTQCTMVPTPRLRQELQACGFMGVKVVARGVDTQQFDPAHRSAALRADWGVTPHTPVVLCVGRLAAEKNLGTLLAAFDVMRRVNPAVRLVLVGDGPERAALQARCPDAIFVGVRRGQDLAAHYASADLFAFPSITETFGNVVPEAMASGLAVLAYDHAAAGQLIASGRNGVLARMNDSQDFCAAAASMVGAPHWLRALGAQARTSATRLDWANVVHAVEGEYINAMACAPLQAATPWQGAVPAG